MFPRISPTELIIILLIVVLLFGAGRIGKIAGELGRGIREFRSGLKDTDAETKPEGTPTEAEPPKENKTE
jgi:sec-independent protein translocase protein TatA